MFVLLSGKALPASLPWPAGRTPTRQPTLPSPARPSVGGQDWGETSSMVEQTADLLALRRDETSALLLVTLRGDF
jgi:hypothetical protein